MDFDSDLGAVTSQCFVDGIVHDFVHQVVKSSGTRRSDVHGGSFTYGFKSFEDFNRTCVVAHEMFFPWPEVGFAFDQFPLVFCASSPKEPV
jgi:hypothetical protein